MNSPEAEAGDQGGASMEMPRYKCHKEVHALKIEGIEPTDAGAILCVEEPFAGIRVPEEWLLKHKPQRGGYYVVYNIDDHSIPTYSSYSPAAPFEAGYSRLRR